MFSFFSRSGNAYKDALKFIGTDMHNHILPGIDDGSPDLNTSIQLTEGLEELGYQAVVATPHIIPDLYPNNASTIEKAFQSYSGVKPPHFFPGGMGFAAEYMIDYYFEALLKRQEILSFGSQKNVLIEMSYLVESPNIRTMIFELVTNGYNPILAHPERYVYYHQRLDIYEELYDTGCTFQLNLLSLSGYYGGGVKRVGEKLIDKGLISWLGTDMHHLTHLENLKRLASDKKILRTLGKIKNLQNPELKLV